MFTKETYIRRRAELKKLVGKGVIVLFGNNDAPCNYPANCYAPMRQDSSFLYYFGQHRDGLVGVIDIDHDEEMLFGDDIDVEDIVWMGFTPSVADLAAEVGVSKTTYLLHQTSDIKNPLSPSLSFRHENTDNGPAGHSSFSAEGKSVTHSNPGSCEDALYQRSTGNRSHRPCLRHRLCHAHHCPAIDQARGDRTLHWRSGRRHCPFAGKPGELRHHLQSAW